MTPLQALQERLATGMTLVPAAPSSTTPLSKLLARLRQRRLRLTGRAVSPETTATLFQLRLGGTPDSAAGVRQLCARLCRPGGWEQQRPLDDPRLLDRLLDHVAGLEDARQFLRCYRALLHSYFSTPAVDAAAGHAGWRRLGEFLQRYLDRACPAAANTGWRRELRRQARLLAAGTPALPPLPPLPAETARFLLRLGVTGGWLAGDGPS